LAIHYRIMLYLTACHLHCEPENPQMFEGSTKRDLQANRNSPQLNLHWWCCYRDTEWTRDRSAGVLLGASLWWR